MKKFISLFLTLMLALSAAVLPAFADDAATVSATVAAVEKYGNLDMDETALAAFEAAGFEAGDIIHVTFGETALDIPYGTNYSDVDTGNLVIRNNGTMIIVAINMGNFAGTYNCAVGDTLTFTMGEKAGYAYEYMLHQLKRTNAREDYASDEVFANFREVTTTGMGSGAVYRSASPINNEIARAAYADDLAEKAGIKTVMNLADSAEAIATYRAAEDFDSPYYAALYDDGKVVTLNMGVDIASADFGTKLVEGLNFLAEGEAPYLFHCTEGKDRAGFTAIVVEALMGAAYEEIVDDYMLTYENYYGIEKGGEQWNAVAESNVIASLTTVVCGKEKGADISSEDLSAAAEKYLVSNGMTAAQVETLKTKLGTPVEKPVTSAAETAAPLVSLEDDAELTRIQLMAMLYEKVKAQGKGFVAQGSWLFPLDFTDMTEIPEGFYETAAWLYMNKIVLGYPDGKLAPNELINREQAVTMLWRLAQTLGVDVSVGEDTNILSYDDAFDISSYACGAFQWACGAGVRGFANGDGEGHILPKDIVTFKEAKEFIESFTELQ